MASELLLRVFPELHLTWREHTLLATDRTGMIGGQGLQGLYEHDVRLLSRYRLLVHGKPPRLVALSSVDPHSTLAYYAAPAAPGADAQVDALGLAEDERDRQVIIRVARFAGRGLHEDLEIANHGLDEAHLVLRWELAADFADLVEQRGGKRQQQATVETAWQAQADGSAELRFDYRHPRLPVGSRISLLPERGAEVIEPRWTGRELVYEVALRPQKSHRLCLLVSRVVDGQARSPLFSCGGSLTEPAGEARAPGAPLADATRLESPNWKVQRAWERAIIDLGSLALGDGQTAPERAVPAAGVPLYVTLFGRDALTTAGQGLIASPALAEGALRLLARHLGTKDDDFYDEQPGRVPQQIRDDPLALLGLVPWRHDYGDYAAPCAYLILLGAYHMATGNQEVTRELLEPARRVLDWLDTRADLDGDGWLEYRTRSPRGQKHQGWKDAGNAVVYPDGTQVEPPIAPSEVQAYWYAAKMLMAEVFLTAGGEPSRAFGLLREARELKRRFDERFWMEDERCIAFALDADKRQVKSIASNAGHCLAAGIVRRRRAGEVVRRLMAPDMFSGWGIRTLSANNPAFNPFKYHLGSVWPAENATIALGMKRYGFATESNAVAGGIFDAAALFEHHRLPETFGGFPRDARHPHPGIYPDACAPQAWSASAIFWLVQAMLGLWTYAPLNVLIVEPALPEWLPSLTLRGLRVRDAQLSIEFRRDASGKTDYRVVERQGTIRVLRQPPPEDTGARPITRLREFVESLLPGHG